MSVGTSRKGQGYRYPVMVKVMADFRVSACRRMPGVTLLVFLSVLIVGCVASPSGQVRQDSGDGIYFVENRSVDLAVRDDFDAATRLLREGRYEQAIELLNKVIQGSQNNSAPYINIAMAYENIGDIKQAETNFERAIGVNPEHPVANNEYGLFLRRAGRYAESRLRYEALLEKYPEFMPARKNLGILCELYLGDAPCALEQYELYANAFPEDESVNLWIAGLKQKLGQ